MAPRVSAGFGYDQNRGSKGQHDLVSHLRRSCFCCSYPPLTRGPIHWRLFGAPRDSILNRWKPSAGRPFGTGQRRRETSVVPLRRRVYTPLPVALWVLINRGEHDPARTPSAELAGVGPLLLDHCPPVGGQPGLHVSIGEPPVSFIAPADSPGIADQQGSFELADF